LKIEEYRLFFKESLSQFSGILHVPSEQIYPMEKPITILIAADHRLVAKAWQFILSLDSRFNVIDGCKDFESVMLRTKTLSPDIILLDINMKRMQEMNLVPVMESVSPGTAVLGICMYTFPGVSETLIQAGVAGYLTKNSSIKELFEAIVKVKAGERYLCAELKKFRHQLQEKENFQKGLELLSLRETDVIAGISNGFSLQEVAQEFKVPYRTIKRHYEMILKKLELNNTSQLIEYLAKQPGLSMN
jgi:DNA-binding NarL/FixJ family response regulator